MKPANRPVTISRRSWSAAWHPSVRIRAACWANRNWSGRHCTRWAFTGSSPGDDKRNASVRLEYRKAGASGWRAGAPFGSRGAESGTSRSDSAAGSAVPDDGWLFAGSVLLLEPGTNYELRLTLDDPDERRSERTCPGC